MQVLLNVEQADEQAMVTVIIGKPIASPPISTEMLTVILENSSGELLKPKSQPDSGILPETHSRGATASARFTFDVDRSVKLKRAILFLRGHSTEFKLC
jgi:hypothetical protein